MYALGKAAIAKFGAIDVMVNNAGIMPLALYLGPRELRCLANGTNASTSTSKALINGIAAVYDQMMPVRATAR